ncbi:hypothetical protein ACI65C_003525 [Semiaphis heraclei]
MNPPKRKNTFMDKFVFKISKNDDDRSTTDDQKSTPTLTSLDTKCEDIIQMQANNKHDIGLFLGKSVDNTLTYEMLMSPWNPCSAYDFKADIGVGKIPFLIIAKYSATIEPITNSLQGINCDLFSANKHIKDLIKYISDDRANNEEMFLILMKDINMYLNELGITLMTPRVSSKQTLRNNPSSSGPEDYYRKSIYIPYLDSLITSLNERFPEDNSKYEIISVHPNSLKRLKTWLRSTVTENRLNGLALVNIYKTFVQAQKSNIFDEAIKLFAMEPRRMQFLFNDQ